MAKKDWNEKQKVAKAVLKFKSGTNTLHVIQVSLRCWKCSKMFLKICKNVIGLRHSTEFTPPRHLFGTRRHKRNEIERSSHWHIDTARLPVGGWKESIGQLYFAWCQKNRELFAEKLCRLLENCPSSAVSVVWKREKRGRDLGPDRPTCLWQPESLRLVLFRSVSLWAGHLQRTRDTATGRKWSSNQKLFNQKVHWGPQNQ